MTVKFLNYLEDIVVGQSANHSKAFSEQDLLLFAEASHDDNPVHLNEEFARTTPFKGRVVHGMLTASLISTVLAKALPGPGCTYMTQTIKFCSPVRIGETVTATLTVMSIDREKNRIVADTICRVGDKVVVEGTAIFMAERRHPVRPALFALPEVRIGLIPGDGGTQRLPRLVGKAVANRAPVRSLNATMFSLCEAECTGTTIAPASQIPR